MKSKYTKDYFDFCVRNSFKLDSPFSRVQYKKRLNELKKPVNKQRADCERKAGEPVIFVGIDDAIAIAVNHVTHTDFNRN